MRRVFLAALSLLIAFSVALPALAQGAPPQGGADKPYTIEYYYKVQWGQSAGISRPLPQEPLPAAEEDPIYGPHAIDQD